MSSRAIDPCEATLGAAAPAADLDSAARRAALRLLVESNATELAGLLSDAVGSLECETVRAPESGLAMVRGRIGGDGAPFNLGEATVTRAAVRLTGGEIGFGYVLGRDKEKAWLVALGDALYQSDRHRAAIEAHVLAPLRARLAAEQCLADARTAATRVDFFTLVRGEG